MAVCLKFCLCRTNIPTGFLGGKHTRVEQVEQTKKSNDLAMIEYGKGNTSIYYKNIEYEN